MESHYFCKKCNEYHEIESRIGIKHLPYNLSKNDLTTFINVATTIPTYEVVTKGIPHAFEGTHDFVREVKIAELLQQKFPNMEAYKTVDGMRDWLVDRLNGSHQSAANALNRLQGDIAGEVDFVRQMQGDLRSLFSKTDFVRNVDGRVTSNNPGIDVVEMNRLTGDVINEYQVKTLRSAETIDQTLKEFLHNDHYRPDITLVGPQELIDRAKEMGLPNPTKVMGTLDSNAASAEALKEKILSGDLSVGFTPVDVTEKLLGGAAIGAAISVTVSGLVQFIQYKNGQISWEQLKERLGKDALKGSIAGGVLAGLTLFIPGGLIGHGIGFVAGITLRRLLDNAFGEGTFGEVLKTANSVKANVELLHHGSIYIAKLSEVNADVLERAVSIINDMEEDRWKADEIYTKLERQHGTMTRIDYSQSAEDILDRCDEMRLHLLGGKRK